MDEFAQSRFRLEARYRHVLVDEFQDTSRAQWELVAQLVAELGRRLRRRRRRAPAVDLHRRRPQAVDLRLPRRRRRRCSTKRRRSSRRCGRTDRRGGRFRSASARRREILAFVNDVFGAIEKAPRSARTRSATTRRSFPLELTSRTGPAARCRRPDDAAIRRSALVTLASSATRCSDGRGSRSPTKSSRLLSGARPSAIATTGVRARRRSRPTSRSCSARATAIAIRGGARAARRLDLRLQGARLLRRRRDPGRGRAAALSRRSAVGPARRGASAVAHRAAVGRGDRARSRRTSRTRLLDRRCRRRRRQPRRDEDRRVLRDAARARCRAGCRGSIGWRRPSCSSRVLRETAYAFETARPATPAGAREPEEAARA